MSHLRLVVPEQEARRVALFAQTRNNRRQELDTVLALLDDGVNFTAADVAAVLMIVAVNIAGALGELMLDSELHTHLMRRLELLNLSSEMMEEVFMT